MNSQTLQRHSDRRKSLSHASPLLNYAAVLAAASLVLLCGRFLAFAGGPDDMPIIQEWDFDSNDPSITLSGDAEMRPQGGVGDSGYLKVTDAANWQQGNAIFPIGMAPGYPNITIDAEIRLGGGTNRPADGISINLVSPCDPLLQDDAQSGWAAGPHGRDNQPEEGSTTGLSIGFDEWVTTPNPRGDMIGISVRVDGNLVAQVELPTLNGTADDPASLQTGPNANALEWEPFVCSIWGDQLTIWWKGEELISMKINFGLPLTEFTHMVIGARTGGANSNHHIDNLKLTQHRAEKAYVDHIDAYPGGMEVRIMDPNNELPDPDDPDFFAGINGDPLEYIQFTSEVHDNGVKEFSIQLDAPDLEPGDAGEFSAEFPGFDAVASWRSIEVPEIDPMPDRVDQFALTNMLPECCSACESCGGARFADCLGSMALYYPFDGFDASGIYPTRINHCEENLAYSLGQVTSATSTTSRGGVSLEESVCFNGESALVVHDVRGEGVAATFLLSFWIKIDDPSKLSILLDSHREGGGTLAMVYWDHQNQRIVITDDRNRRTGCAIASPNEWHRVTIAYGGQGSNVIFHVDDTPMDIIEQNGGFQGPWGKGSLSIGGKKDGDPSGLNGYMDEVFIFDLDGTLPIGMDPKVYLDQVSEAYSANDNDGDGLSDKQEAELGTDPNRTDSDGDGTWDGMERSVGTDPLNGLDNLSVDGFFNADGTATIEVPSLIESPMLLKRSLDMINWEVVRWISPRMGGYAPNTAVVVPPATAEENRYFYGWFTP